MIFRPPGLRDHHHDSVGERASGLNQKLEDIVEYGRIAPGGVDDRLNLFQLGSEQRRFEIRFSGAHPIDVPPQGVDLPVVGDIAEGLGQFPGGERVGAVTLMDNGKIGFKAIILQVGVENRDLRGGKHSLINDRPG